MTYPQQCVPDALRRNAKIAKEIGQKWRDLTEKQRESYKKKADKTKKYRNGYALFLAEYWRSLK